MISKLATRVIPTHANNFRVGRAWKNSIDCIVIHVTEGTASSVRAWFTDPTAMVSAHYMVTAAGGIESFVDEADTAYHAGQLVNPSNALVNARHESGGYTPNSYAIGIEHEGDGKHELTAAQRAATYALIRDIRTRHPVPLDRTHIMAHHEVKASKTCPGAIDVDRIVADLKGGVVDESPPAVVIDAPPTPAPTPARADAVPVYSPTLGWLIPVTITDDAHWTFATVSDVRDAIHAGRAFTTMEAGQPLSRFPRAR